jgi:diguanylate cyclase (GGDEF)-like protein/PAS domain S-box-containing protein
MKDARAPTGQARSQPHDVHASGADTATVEARVDTAGPRPIGQHEGPRLVRPDPLRSALLDSRQRWRDLVTLAADIAFETDAAGRFVFVAPAEALGWQADTLLGQPAALLLADRANGAEFDPFRVVAPVRARRAWLRRQDGSLVCLSFAAAPLLDSAGSVVGARGLGQDVTEQDGSHASVAAALRRAEVMDHILWRMRHEVLAPRMMAVVLEALTGATGAEGTAVIDMLGDGVSPTLLHSAGRPAPSVLHPALLLLEQGGPDGGHALAPDGRPVLVCQCQTRFGEQAGLVLWRAPDGRPWDDDDRATVVSTSILVRVVLEHESIQREMARQARTDPLTGLLNRRAFLDEVARRIDRLDREGLPGTLMFIDLDNFKALNDTRGHDVGDEALCITANLLRATVRPSDLVARLGGDEFALWLDGTDDLSAAERAEMLRTEGPRALAHLSDAEGPAVTMSIGIAARWPGRGEDIEVLIHRADQVMYEVKRSGRGHWRVARSDGW